MAQCCRITESYKNKEIKELRKQVDKLNDLLGVILNDLFVSGEDEKYLQYHKMFNVAVGLKPTIGG